MAGHGVRTRGAAVAVALAAGLSGCAQDSDDQRDERPERAAVKTSMLAGARAFTARDAKSACALVTDAGQDQLVAAYNSGQRHVADTCEDVARIEFRLGPLNLRPKALIFRAIRVDGGEATVRLTEKRFPDDSATVYLRKADGRWKIDRAGSGVLPEGD